MIDNDDSLYAVVINHEEQYSVWPTAQPVPSGWRRVGMNGPKRECLAFIDATWSDMRPLSLRRRLAPGEPDPAE